LRTFVAVHGVMDVEKNRVCSAARRRGAQSGFTLIEVMVVTVIVAILATFAVPNYTDYVRRSQLNEAFNALGDYQVKLEQYYQDNRNYGNSGGTTCANATGAPAWSNFQPPGARYFTFSCALGGSSGSGNQSYTLTATGSGGRATGHVFTLTSSGTRATTQFKGATVARTCWLVRGDEC
jgi:type IV pilus assembly protein PilE